MTTILCPGRPTYHSVVEAWMDDHCPFDHENRSSKRRRTTWNTQAPGRPALRQLDRNMSFHETNYPRVAADRSEGRRTSPRKKFVAHEKEKLETAIPSIEPPLPIRPPLDGEQEISTHESASHRAGSSGVPEPSFSSSTYAKALSLQNRPARSGPGSQRSQPGRGASPVKNTTTLRRLPKPVVYGQLRKTSDLPYVSGLCQDLDAIIKVYWNRGSDFDARQCEDPHSVDWHDLTGDDDHRDPFWQEHEFQLVGEVQSCAEKLEQTAAGEPAWNDEVHSAILRIALSKKLWSHQASARVGYSNITTAQIVPAFRPTTESSSFQTKLIDYCMHVEPSSPVQPALRSVLNALPPDQATVNQTMYGPVAERPIFVSIETKVSQSSEEEGKAQLGIWTDTGDRRVRSLRDFTMPPDLQGLDDSNWTRIPEPLLLVSGHHWDLYLAIDVGDKIEALRYRQHLGTTKSIGDIYMLLATVRRLAVWGVEVFCPWWEQHVLHIDVTSIT